MKRIFVLITLITLFGGSIISADKVIEKSSRHQPAWLGGMQDGYIIVAAEAETLDAAQQKAITGIREQILAAVATKVQSSTAITLHEVTDNGNIQSHRELVSLLSVEAADLPYLANISPSHAEDYWWCKVRRNDKTTYYQYNVKYPLSSSKLRMLVEQYEKQQQAITDSLQYFAAVDFSNYDALESMLQVYSDLRRFNETLRDDSHHALCDAIRRGYDRMLSTYLRPEVVTCTRDSLHVRLMYGDKPVTHNLRPKAKSNCLTAIEVTPQKDEDLVTYDYQTGCYDDDQNWIELIYTVLGRKYTTRKYIK